MTENQYRIVKSLLLAIFIGGVLYIGSKWVENGRYKQYDTTIDNIGNRDYLFDTREGKVVDGS